uniref:Uncharacterized protein n=1 Tax=Melanopsichium pennsylvanicum 4 TaxID=1398559 RepID=A0A077RA73_9BASI|nr:putative protein [Melanopsichium pennsylvanicum 4]
MFITAYIKTGSLIALTHQSDAPGFSAGLQDSACIDGQGTLVLSLCKDTYQTLGLTGSASHFSRLSSGRAADRTSGPDSRFIVELPLLSPSFVPGKKGYQKVLDRLRAWDQSRATALNTHQTIAQTHASSNITAAHGPVTSQHATWDMLFVWSPSRMHTDLVGAPTLSSSVNEIRFPDHLVSAQHVETIKLQPIQPIVTDSVWIPNLTQHPLAHPWRENERHFTELEPAIHLSSDSMATWCEYQDGLQQAIEWAGLASLGANSLRTFTRPDSTCVYTPPSPSSPGRTVKLSWSAPDNKSTLISPLLVSIIVNQVNGFIADSKRDSSPILENENVEWATLSIHPLK